MVLILEPNQYFARFAIQSREQFPINFLSIISIFDFFCGLCSKKNHVTNVLFE